MRGAAASIDTARQYVSVPGVARLNSDDGMHGTLTEVRSDLKADITNAEGPVDITFPDGTHLEAADLLYEGKLAYWTFNRSTVTIPNLPRTAVPRIPFFTSAWVIQ